tara:strand:- start:2865 stop:3416 length:552 start_codon:yes stop_codon:yes gene_type:complete
MNYAELKTTVMSEINDVLTSVDEKSLDIMCDIIQSSNKIVVAGAGRMGYSIKCFGMRLGHMGYQAWTLGDSTVPQIGKGDLLIVASGSGETETIYNIVLKAKQNRAKVILITTKKESRMASSSDHLVIMNAVSAFTGDRGTIQPMKTYVEQSLLILLDIMALKLMQESGETNFTMSKRHSLLE